MSSEPTGWTATLLGEQLSLLKDGTHGSFSRTQIGVPFLSAKNISNSGHVVFDDTDDFISERDYRAIHSTFSLKAGDLLLTIVGSLGRRALFRGERVTFQRSVAYLRSNGRILNPGYLFHLVSGTKFQQELVSRSNATAQAGVYLGELAQIAIALPPLSEQNRITEILDTLDDQIRATEQIIDKLRLVKLGLLHDLIERSGTNNPRRAIGEFANTYSGGTPSRTVPGMYGGSIPWVKSGEVNKSVITSTEENITPTALQLSSARWVPSEVPLIAMYGATAGVVSWTAIPVTTNQAVLAVLPSSDQINARWLYWSLVKNSPKILASVQGSGQPNLSKGTIDRYRMTVPCLAVQQRAVDVLDAHEGLITAELQSLMKLRTYKRGVMSDLLTGRVRAPEEAAS